jgi:protein-disulfide isomerase
MDNQKIMYGIIGILALVGMLVGGYMFTNQPAQQTQGDDTVYAQTAEVKPEDHTKWASGSANILTEYSDLQCPACRNFHLVLEELEKDPAIAENITLVYRHFPLVSIHPNAQMAAYAAEAAGRQGKFFEMVDKLFDTQQDWEAKSNARELFIGYAGELGMDTAQFEQDLSSDEVTQKVQADQESGIQSNVQATPTFYLNGKKLNPATTEEFKQILLEAAAQNPAQQEATGSAEDAAGGAAGTVEEGAPEPENPAVE